MSQNLIRRMILATALVQTGVSQREKKEEYEHYGDKGEDRQRDKRSFSVSDRKEFGSGVSMRDKRSFSVSDRKEFGSGVSMRDKRSFSVSDRKEFGSGISMRDKRSFSVSDRKEFGSSLSARAFGEFGSNLSVRGFQKFGSAASVSGGDRQNRGSPNANNNGKKAKKVKKARSSFKLPFENLNLDDTADKLPAAEAEAFVGGVMEGIGQALNVQVEQVQVDRVLKSTEDAGSDVVVWSANAAEDVGSFVGGIFLRVLKFQEPPEKSLRQLGFPTQQTLGVEYEINLGDADAPTAFQEHPDPAEFTNAINLGLEHSYAERGMGAPTATGGAQMEGFEVTEVEEGPVDAEGNTAASGGVRVNAGAGLLVALLALGGMM